MPTTDTPDVDVQPCDCGKVVPKGEHHCWEHHVCEITEGEYAYQICGECFHVYKTEADLEAAYVREVTAINAAAKDGFDYPLVPKKASEIYFCQECIHDF